MKIVRSIKCHFQRFATQEKKDKIENLIKTYSQLVTEAIELFEPGIQSGGKKFDFMTGEMAKLLNTPSTARFRKNAIAEAYGLVKGNIESCKALNQTYVRPTHSGKSMTLSETNAQIILDPETKNFDLLLRIHSIGNRESIYIPLKRNKQFNKWFERGTLAKTVIITRDYVQFIFHIETGPKKIEGEVLGIDIGMNKLLATTQRKFIGEDIRKKLDTLHRKKFKSGGYQRAKEDLKESINFYTKQLPWEEISGVVVENLKGLKHKTKKKPRRRRGKQFRRLLHNWNYRQVLTRIQALSEENRVFFRSVSPWKTSQTCPVCGNVEQGNRLSQDLFKCLKCSHTDNADLVGALNILNRFTTGAYGPGYKPEIGLKEPS